MTETRTVTYPASAVEYVADCLQDQNWGLDRADAEDQALDIVIEVTRRVDNLRASERNDA